MHGDIGLKDVRILQSAVFIYAAVDQVSIALAVARNKWLACKLEMAQSVPDFLSCACMRA